MVSAMADLIPLHTLGHYQVVSSLQLLPRGAITSTILLMNVSRSVVVASVLVVVEPESS